MSRRPRPAILDIQHRMLDSAAGRADRVAIGSPPCTSVRHAQGAWADLVRRAFRHDGSWSRVSVSPGRSGCRRAARFGLTVAPPKQALSSKGKASARWRGNTRVRRHVASRPRLHRPARPLAESSRASRPRNIAKTAASSGLSPPSSSRSSSSTADLISRTRSPSR